MQIEALKRKHGKAKKMYGEREYHFTVIHVDETTHLHCDLLPLTKPESIGEKT